MVKVTILSEEKDKRFHTVIVFYKYDSDKRNYLHSKWYNKKTKETKSRTFSLTAEEFARLKEAI